MEEGPTPKGLCLEHSCQYSGICDQCQPPATHIENVSSMDQVSMNTTSRVLLSIATCVLNARDDFVMTATSLPQKLPEWVEWVVVDGASTDGTVDAITSDTRVGRYVSEKDNGVYDAYNKALKLATGRYIWYLNAGDTAEAEALSELQNRLSCLVDVDRLPVLCSAVHMATNQRVWLPNPDSLEFEMSVPTPGVFFPRDALISLGGFDSSYKVSGDYEVLLRLKMEGRHEFEINQGVLTDYKGGGISTTQNGLAFFEECVALLRVDRTKTVHCLLRAARRLVFASDISSVPYRRWRIALAAARRILY